jgi:hypothetical protein
MPEFIIAGRKVRLSPASVRAALQSVQPEPVAKHAIEIDGRLYPAVQALEAASGVPRAETRSARARQVFAALGFRLVVLGTERAVPRDPLTRGVGSSTALRGPEVGKAPHWAEMDSRPRHRVADLNVARITKGPGVYAFYRDGAAVYVGKAESGLRRRLERQHLDVGRDLSWSAFRRNVAEMLGVAPTSITRARPPVLTDSEVAPVVAWVRACEVAWIECSNAAASAALETALKSEWKPSLTKR